MDCRLTGIPATARRGHGTTVTLLAGLGLLSALVYGLGLVACYPLAAGLQRPLATWARLAGFSPQAAFLLAGTYALLMAYYALALRLALRAQMRRSRALPTTIVAVWLLASVILLGAYPGESLDIFDYLFRGRMVADLSASPLATTPAAFPEQRFYAYVNWTTYVDTYGPIWEYASGAVAALVGALSVAGATSLSAYILGYRLLAIGVAGLCGALIYLIVRRQSPQRAAAALLAWLWNPLLLTASAIGAHNDMLMLLAILCAVALFQHQRWLWGLLTLVLAAHVKLTALLLLPMFGLWVIRRCGVWRATRISAAMVALAPPLSWLLYAPLGGWATLPRMLDERVRLLANSPAFVVYWALQVGGGWSEVDAWRVTTRGATLLFFAIAAYLLVRFWRLMGAASGPDDALLWRGGIAVTAAFLLVGSFWFWHWYLMWMLVLAVLLPASRFTLRVLPVCCLGALWLFIVTDWLLPQDRPLVAPVLDGGAATLTWSALAIGFVSLPLVWRVTRVGVPLEWFRQGLDGLVKKSFN